MGEMESALLRGVTALTDCEAHPVAGELDARFGVILFGVFEREVEAPGCPIDKDAVDNGICGFCEVDMVVLEALEGM